VSKSKASRDTVLAREREREALELRKTGMTREGIAEAMGLSVSGAFGAVSRALARLVTECTEGANELRRLEVERLDHMLAAISPAIDEGDLAAIDRALRIQERRAKLLGLDSPSQQQLDITRHTVELDLSDIGPSAELARG
jgi:DNA-binding CsgD family transcriptional regulator